MSEKQFFKIKKNTRFDNEIKGHFSMRSKWDNVFSKVSELLGEEITKMALDPEELIIDVSQLNKDENKKLFTKDGCLKKNLNAAKNIRQNYKEIVKKGGLSDFKQLRFINFAYGVMRMRGQELKSFRTSENDIYYECDFDLEKQTNGLVIPISEIEYEEKYLEELKK